MRGVHVRLLALVAITVCASANAQVLFEDDFNGSISAAWTITNADANFYSLNSSELVLQIPSNDIFVGAAQPKNFFYMNNPASGDFAATLKIDSFVLTDANYAQIDVIAYDNPANLVRCNYGYINGPALQFGKQVSGGWSPLPLTPIDLTGGGFYLRLSKSGTIYFQSYSFDGITYTSTGQTLGYTNAPPTFLGFCAVAVPTQSSFVYHDSFTVEGPITIAASIAPAVQVSWSTVVGVSYQLQSSTNISSTNWVNVGSPITALDNSGTNVFQLTAGTNAKFFRVIGTP